jgi:SAM-dependent methyltransferase
MNRPFKEVFYENYRSTHTVGLYGNAARQDHMKRYPTWDRYFGAHLTTEKAATILDVGCGDGAFVDYLHRRGYSNAEGVDLSAEQIEYGLGLGIKNISVADLTEKLSTARASYDTIVARDVLEHFTHQAAFETAVLVFQSLKPGGRFIMQVPNGQGLFYTSIYWGDFTHELAFTESSIRQLFGNAGFSSSKCFPCGPVPHSLRSRIRAILWSYKVAQTKFWRAVETASSGGIYTANLIAVGEKAR